MPRPPADPVLTRLEQGVLAFVYALTASAGPFALIHTPLSMIETVGERWSTAWAVFILLGSTGCLLGAIWGVWLWEYICLPLLASAVAVYGAVRLIPTETDPGRSAGGLLLLATAGLLLLVWLQRRREARADVRPKETRAGR